MSVCLHIPVPQCLRELARAPPVILSGGSDAEVVRAINDFGEKLGCTKAEIQKACDLAAGPADVVVILERPGFHNYDCRFEDFVSRCVTLNAVDDLIKFATNGARSIHTTSVLDAFFFKPKNRSVPSDEACHKLMACILKIKRPRVILCCWADWLSLFASPEIGKGPMRSREVIKGYPMEVIRSFHPSYALNRVPCDADLRYILMFHFVLAFNQLDKPIQIPAWVDSIEKSAWLAKPRPSLNQESAQKQVIQILRSITGIQGKRLNRVGFSSEKRQEIKVERERELDHLLNSLNNSSYMAGALVVARLILLLKEYFKAHPLHCRFAALFLELGKRQTVFKETEGVVADGGLEDLEKAFPLTHLSQPPVTG